MTGSPSSALRLAATAIPLRETARGIEVLMLERNADLSFGGMWAFPGGSFEAIDGPTPGVDTDEELVDWGAPGLLTTAANAAARETAEETGLTCSTASFAWFSHWIPPRVGPPKRFSTWFFIAPETSGELVVDRRESSQVRWVTPREALEGYERAEFPMAAPTWCTLHDMAEATAIGALIDEAITQGPRLHHTRAYPTTQGRALVWIGDASYDSGDLLTNGPRNRMLVDDQFTVLERLT